ncbi:MAG: 4Fe-4S binding protein [Clostridiales bacterium]|nr:4Fe-4S binding protein [Clostridiales bacterium]MCF8023516.1 4Fe-4S binding protein [Clostridiales bacterium]
MKITSKRKQLQLITWIVLPLVIIFGLIYPAAGFLLFACMLGAVGLSFTRGRSWCDWMCPRGAFYDLFFNRISPNKKVPRFFKKTAVRVFMIGVIFTAMGVQFYFAWGDLNAMGAALLRILIITTIAGIILALTIHPRTWCHICPMGTIASWIGKRKLPVQVSEQCSLCGLCSKVCPMQLSPYEYKDEGLMEHGDCIKCSTCVNSCPVKALSIQNTA